MTPTVPTAVRWRGGALALALPALALPALALAVGRLTGVEQLAALGAILLGTLAPGAMVALALGRRVSLDARFAVQAIAIGIGVLNAALVAAMVTGGTLRLVLALELATALVGLAVALGRRVEVTAESPGRAEAAAAALVLAAATLAGSIARFRPLDDDGFHLNRARLLLRSDGLEPLGLTELIAGSDHPGYALPGWHAIPALGALGADIDPIAAIPAAAALAAAGAMTVAWALGGLVHRDLRIPAGIAALALGFWVTARWTGTHLPGGGATLVLVPAGLFLAVTALRRPSAATTTALVAIGLGVAGSHVTYIVPLGALIVGAAVGEALQRRSELAPLTAARRAGVALVAVGLPIAAYTLWVRDLAGEARAVAAGRQAAEIGTRFTNVLELGPLTVMDPLHLVDASTLAPAIAACALLAWRGGRLLSGCAIGAMIGLAALAYAPPLFSAFVAIASVSQAQRTLLMLPLALLVAVAAGGAAGLRGRRRVAALALLGAAGALVAAHQLELASAAAVAVGLALIAVAAVVVGWRGVGQPAPWALALALVLLVVPALVTRAPAAPRPPYGAPLPAGLADALETLPAGSGVAAQPRVAYRITGFTDVPVFSSMPTHVALTAANAPYRRNAINRRLMDAGTPDAERIALARAQGVDAIVALERGSRRLSEALARAGWPVLAEGPGWRIYGVPQGP